MRDRTPEAPRDLWARTAAAIELESRHRALQPRRRTRRSLLAPYAVLAGVVVVAILVGNLTSSRITPEVATTTPGTALAATDRPTAAPTPVDVGSREVAYLSRDRDGRYQWNNTRVHEVCPDAAETCATTEPNEKRTLGPLPSPESVFGADDGSLVVLGDDEQGSRVLVVTLPEQSPPRRTPRRRARQPDAVTHGYRRFTVDPPDGLSDHGAQPLGRRSLRSSHRRRSTRANRPGRSRSHVMWRSSKRPPPTHPTDRPSRSRLVHPTDRRAPTSTSGTSAKPRQGLSRPTIDPSSDRGPVTRSSAAPSSRPRTDPPTRRRHSRTRPTRRSRPFPRRDPPGARPSIRLAVPRSTGPGPLRRLPTETAG